MRCYSPTGTGTVKFNGRSHPNFVPWILDHTHTAKGMRYFSNATAGLVELLRENQREDGMIWSFAQEDPGPGYFDTRDAGAGYTRRSNGLLLVRQPVENHCESNFVSALFIAWQSSGDDEWMKATLDSAIRALDYTMNDPARWSHKFGLLKRGYTIDSWDFQVDDHYAVKFPIGTDMMIDPDRTKFGVFFGDNTGYAHACLQLATMLRHAGRPSDAEAFEQRGSAILERLSALSWNGAFFTHRIEEDPDVHRDLGVDESTQIAMSNAYSVNRGISPEQCAAILRTYRDLSRHLPTGSPGEWYSIYPPFERGFGAHSGRWQYMNGGVHAHAAGELARGAFEHGFERYGTSILQRIKGLAQKTDGIVHFAYTGAIDDAPPQSFTCADISHACNMDIWDMGAPGVPGWMGGEPGNDMRHLPVGNQMFSGIPYDVADPAQNGRRSAIGVSISGMLPSEAEVHIEHKAASVYLLHTADKVGKSGIAASVTMRYDDNTEHTQYLIMGKHLTGWWFPTLDGTDAGVAWQGPNPRSTAVGMSWAALSNPYPEKLIRSIVFAPSREGGTYAVLGVTISDSRHHREVSPISTGGPDNWAGGTCMAALVEGLAGATDLSTKMDDVRLSPRWSAAGSSDVAVTARYGASYGYVAYRYSHDVAGRQLQITITGSGHRLQLRLLLPQQAKSLVFANLDGAPVTVTTESVEGSIYAVVPIELNAPTSITMKYDI
jgi:hypothetical protein